MRPLPPLGLADDKTIILDPATGTATFLHTVVQHIHQTLVEQGISGSWNSYVAQNLLPRVFGFELLMAPYTVAHLKMGLLLKELGYNFASNERLGIYLTNTLAHLPDLAQQMPFAQYIADEGQAANEVKHGKPVMVVIGNPPYSNFGMMNKGEWIGNLIEDYKRGLKEKKLNLDDDYIKFLRFGQWRIESSGAGILAVITNNSYINGITHRRMRQSLLETFSDIYILDLHGDSNKKEKAPDGSPDENVFDILQGVAVALFVKEPGKTGLAQVHHAELWGRREQKYARLVIENVFSIEWTSVSPAEDRYSFVPSAATDANYQSYFKINEAMSLSGGGLNTDRDELCIDFETEPLSNRMQTLFSGNYDTAFRDQYNIYPSSSYDVEARARTSRLVVVFGELAGCTASRCTGNRYLVSSSTRSIEPFQGCSVKLYCIGMRSSKSALAEAGQKRPNKGGYSRVLAAD